MKTYILIITALFSTDGKPTTQFPAYMQTVYPLTAIECVRAKVGVQMQTGFWRTVQHAVGSDTRKWVPRHKAKCRLLTPQAPAKPQPPAPQPPIGTIGSK